MMSDQHHDETAQQVKNSLNKGTKTLKKTAGRYAKKKARQALKKAGSQAAKKAGKAGAKAAGKAGKAGAKAAGKAMAKAGSMIAKTAAKLVVQGIMALVTSIASIGLPILIAIAAILLLFFAIYIIDTESRPVNQNVQSESATEMNKQEFGDSPQGTVTEVSDYNLVVNAFYMNYALKSYHQFYEGELKSPGETFYVKPKVERANGDTVEAKEQQELKDSKNLESNFLLNFQLLWQLDEYLHDRKFKYPESFIKPLYYEETKEGDTVTFTLKDLTDENGNLVAQSNVYDDEGIRTEEKTEGVWDYGLSPIISYKTYLKDARYEFDVTGKAYTYSYTLPDYAILPDGQERTVTGTVGDSLTEAAIQKFAKDDEYLPNPEFIHMIDQVLTFVGSFKPQISYEWSRDTQALETFKEYSDNKEYTKTYDMTFEKMVQATDSQGKPLKAVMIGGKKVSEVSEGCYRVDMNDPNYRFVLHSTCGGGIIAQSDTNITFENIMVKRKVTEPVLVTVKDQITYHQYLSKIEPSYMGDPQISDFKGGSYLKDYMHFYETYVPETVLNDLDLSNRVAKDPEKLQEIVDSYNKIHENGVVVSGEGNMVGDFSQGAYDNALRYLDLFKKYGEMYGVDPYLLLAKAAQESSGDHESNLTGGAAVGLTQIQYPGRADGYGVSQVTAYNHQTGQTDKRKVCKGNSNSPAGCLNAYILEENIQIGAMQLAQRLSVFDGHHMLALQSYNFGEGGMRQTVRACGYDPAVVMRDQYDLDWMKCRQLVHENPHTYIDPEWPKDTYGDPVYLENVLKFYRNPETDNHLVYTDSKGTTHRFDTSKINLEGLGGANFSSTGSSGVSIGGGLLGKLSDFLKNQISKITDGLKELFTDVPEHFGLPDKVGSHHESSLTPLDMKIMETMIFAMKEQVNMDQIGEVTDEMWRERYGSVFVSSSASSVVSGEFAGDADPYFQGGARTPLPMEMNPVFTYAYRTMINGNHNYGVGLNVSPSTKIYAIYDGTVLSVEEVGGYRGYVVKIQHKDGLTSEYGNLNKETVTVKSGDSISRGDVIGEVAAAKNPKNQLFHFELRQHEIPINPTFLFSSPGGGDYFIPITTGSFAIPLVKGYVSCEWMCYPEHYGIDLGNHGDQSTPVVAAADGTVLEVRRWNGIQGEGGDYGHAVLLQHNIDGRTYATMYAHLRDYPTLKRGDVVKQGQKLGTMGNTGYSFGAHLHFEIRDGSTAYSAARNPRNYISFPKNWNYSNSQKN